MSRRILISTLVAVSVIAVLVLILRHKKQAQAEEFATQEEAISRLIASERTIREISPALQTLSDAAQDATFLPLSCAPLFHPQVTFYDLTEQQASPEKSADYNKLLWIGVKKPSTPTSNSWSQLYKHFQSVEHASYKVVTGSITTEGQFDAQLSFRATAIDKSEQRLDIQSTIETSWTLNSTTNQWQISHWSPLKVIAYSSSTAYFKDVVDEAIPSERVRKLLAGSSHEQVVIDLLTKGKALLPDPSYNEFFRIDSSADHPGMSVVDIDQDGYDDLYLMFRWSKNILLRNRGDGTFESIAPQYGLDINGLTTCGIFSDFDNDGDPDLIVGRNFERSLYYRNDEGYFTEQTQQHFSSPLPALVSSICVADHNNDGLLDIYFSTYGNFGESYMKMAKKFLPAKDYDKLDKLLLEMNKNGTRYTHLDGPPNRLFTNQGGAQFKLHTNSPDTEVWQTTLQSVWSDIDGDGDQDLYVSNDFGPDAFLENKQGKFSRVTPIQQSSQMSGFGMGATWGDYNLDGNLDLYVSNMYSKAGIRVTKAFKGLNPALVNSALGNRLYTKQQDQTLVYSNGKSSPFAIVAKADWSWGGQFIDFNNDAYLDLYVPNGYFSAPEEIAGKVPDL